jgi:hypothetical protein
METLRAGMEFRGIAIHSVADGPVTKVHTGIKGLMGSLFLDALKAHTRGGMAGKVREGRAGGGRLYGYKTGIQKGDRVIVPEESAVAAHSSGIRRRPLAPRHRRAAQCREHPAVQRRSGYTEETTLLASCPRRRTTRCQ